ncbi:cytidine deaminase NDAI_0G02240 [Naumovozyma dairenensis CBS 421]|uniref:Cytidine deaminase n=1 Tax=Naumovozyma dairenensis (strain ATCC 10597 / BCRC 20456 / CBS 421 / NBRC 0211 / NRRL Y-12639) TaxID=1071378 RepID=G0WDY8_NAUDC|nr:hypothetical protein NDAI_0G02240 [Naumovozyma dairenensis CBS 421]CCD25999.2 hypothetical protein NDAI_0G02240 [Naumovozyma dairenensis CBS 421]
MQQGAQDEDLSKKLHIPIEIGHKLISKLIESKSLSYSPYSHFKVGCCLLIKNNETTSDGESFYSYVLGANIENASYGASICAERTTIVKALTSTTTTTTTCKDATNWVCIAIIGGCDNDDGGKIISPCGICRQVIREFVPLDFPIVMFNADASQWECKTMEQLLPDSFGPDHLTHS